MWQSANLSLKDRGLWWSFNWKDWTEAVLQIRRSDRTTAVRPVMAAVRGAPWRALRIYEEMVNSS